MQVHSTPSRSFLAVSIAVFLLAFSFNAYACVLPLSWASDASMANGCSTPTKQPARQLCDAFKTMGVESHAQSSTLLVDHHWQVDHALVVHSVMTHSADRLCVSDQPFESSSPPHPSLASTVLRI